MFIMARFFDPVEGFQYSIILDLVGDYFKPSLGNYVNPYEPYVFALIDREDIKKYMKISFPPVMKFYIDSLYCFKILEYHEFQMGESDKARKIIKGKDYIYIKDYQNRKLKVYIVYVPNVHKVAELIAENEAVVMEQVV